MNPATPFCPHLACPARGQTGQGHLRIPSCKDPRFLGTACHQTFSATTGPAWYRLRTAVETVSLVVTLLAHGCPRQALVVACGFGERMVAAGWARAGRQGQAVQEHLVEHPRDLGQGQADERRVKTQGGIVWMALARMVKTRLWLAGEVSEHGDVPLMRPLIARVRRGAMPRPLLWWTAGLASYLRAMRETCRDAMPTGAPGRPRLRPWRHLDLAQVVKRDAQRHVVEVARRILSGPARARRDAQASLTRARGEQHGRHRAAQGHVPGALGVADTSWAGAGASDADAAAWEVSHRKRRQLLSVPCQSAPRRLGGRHAVFPEDSSQGRRDHRSWLGRPGTAVVLED